MNLSRHTHLSLVLLRFVVAAVFLYHGTMKWGLWSVVPEGMPQGMLLIMRFLAIAEPLAAIGLLLGLFTRAAALGLMCVMVSAMYIKITGGQSFGKWELDLLLFAASFTLFLQGSGGMSLDSLRGRKA